MTTGMFMPSTLPTTLLRRARPPTAERTVGETGVPATLPRFGAATPCAHYFIAGHA